jgi:hypothetical protein
MFTSGVVSLHPKLLNMQAIGIAKQQTGYRTKMDFESNTNQNMQVLVYGEWPINLKT